MNNVEKKIKKYIGMIEKDMANSDYGYCYWGKEIKNGMDLAMWIIKGTMEDWRCDINEAVDRCLNAFGKDEDAKKIAMVEAFEEEYPEYAN